MEEIIKIVFSSFWHFVGFALLLSGVGNFLLIVWHRFMRHLNIRKHGWPPAHCDADGDFKEEKKANDKP